MGATISRHYDVIVAGLGAMGSATLYELSRRGVSCLGLDRYNPPHTQGSTHGQSRIIREAYWEHPLYVPLVRRAYECWENLEQESGSSIFRQTGGLMLGPEDGAIVAGSKASALEHHIGHQMLSASEIRRSFPGFNPPDDFVGLLEERAGILFPETAVTAFLDLGRGLGAVIQTGVRVESWKASSQGVRLETTAGPVLGNQLVLTLGPWLQGLLGPRGNWFEVERQTLHWFTPKVDCRGWPIALWEYQPGRQVYTIPEGLDRVKGGIHHEGERVDPESVSREVTPDEDARMGSLVARYQPGADGRLIDSMVCLYTDTPDGDFVIDRHPDHDNVLIVSPCSGHGFKFASAIGELVADLVTTGRCRFDLTSFALTRFGDQT